MADPVSSELLAAQLGEQRGLLVLDNCEQAVSGCAELLGVTLPRCPQLHVLATSRESLGIYGEAVRHVRPLSLPEDDGLGSVLMSEAGQLFVHRARLVSPEFQPGEAGSALIRQVCTRLDAMPLAIELAAAQTSGISLERIVRGLDDRFRTLVRKGAPAADRHRSLETSIDWSYRLLADEEQRVFRRLSIFAGGFSLEAAIDVARDDNLDSGRAEEIVTALVDKSLVSRVTDPETGDRYLLLETLRCFAADQLVDVAERRAARGRQVAWYKAWSDRIGAEMEGRGAFRAIHRVDSEFENLRAVVATAEARGDWGPIAEIVSSLTWYWVLRGHLRECSAWLDRVEANVDQVPPATRIALRWSRAFISSHSGTDETAIKILCEDLRAEAHAAGDLWHEGRALGQLAAVEVFFGRPAGPVLLQQALSLSRRAADHFWVTYLTGNLALHQQNVERHDLAMGHLNEMARGVEANGGPQLLVFYLARRAAAELRFGNVAHASELIARAQASSELITQINVRFFALEAAAERDLLRGLPSASLGDLQASLERFLAAGEFQFIPLICDDIARVLITQDKPAEAIDLLAPIAANPHVQSIVPYAHRLRETIALATWISGDIPTARRQFETLAQDAENVGNIARVARAEMALGAICRHAGDRRAARSCFEQALATFHALGFRPDVAAALRELAGLAVDSPGWEKAAYLHGAADTIDHRDGICYRIARQDTYDADRQSVHAALGDVAFKDAIKVGTSLAIADAVSYASRPDEARRRTRYGWGSLTHAEQQVAALVCEGLTNPEIAAKLMIGRETVKTHLASTYRKLSIKNRTELAAASTRRDITDSPVE